ncbi:hypothetical protein SAMN05446635_7381 [Burkholderia sp. OK233]|nr:hypothetical protein SAMN05446635_7381 [Burkholderia sp. OK233]
MSVQEPALTLRPAQETDERFLFELHKTTMTEHLARAARVSENSSKMTV